MENRSTSILLLPPIKVTESLRAYMFRAARANAYPRLYAHGGRTFDSAAGFMYLIANRDPELRRKLENRLAPPRTITTDKTPPLLLGEEQIPSKYVLIQNRRVCPICLESNAWARGEWELKSVTACPLHKVELVSRCHSCNRTLTWNSTELLHCFCGHALATIHTKPAMACDVRWAQQIQLAVSYSIHGKPTRSGVPTLESMRLSKLLLISEVVKELVLARHTSRQADAQHQKQLVTQILVDDSFRLHLWESMFLHAAAEPSSFGSKLQLGQDVEELSRNYSDLVSKLSEPRALMQGSPTKSVRVRGRAQQWRRHVFKLKKFYRSRVMQGANPFDPGFARQAGERL